jgi:hypothetical protein
MSTLNDANHRYVTLFDRFFLPRAWAMLDSLHAVRPGARVLAVCLDDAAESDLRALNLPGVEPIALKQIEAFDARLPAVRPHRSLLGYYFTLTPSVVRFALAHDATAERVSYLDADLYFYGDPADALAPIESASIAASEHRFACEPERQRHIGRFNVGLVSFRRNAETETCLARWQDQCLAACDEDFNPQLGTFGDQRYLDEWPELYPGFAVIDHRGANVGPWNLAARPIRHAADRRGLEIDGVRLLYFHFSGLRALGGGLWDTTLRHHQLRLDRGSKRFLYQAYVRDIESRAARLDLPRTGSARRAEQAVRINHTPLKRFWRLLRDWRDRQLVRA